ncbi:MAG: hypothetical protein OD815_001574 [Candidatus Alkanophagales archaeon MCA70_species_2]|nr:hypothetical protein [Candidatus Alkanophaga liquidiphilum]
MPLWGAWVQIPPSALVFYVAVQSLTIMKITTVVFIALLVLFFVLPILSGYAGMPTGIGPREIGEFAGGVLRYWLIVLSKVFHAIFTPAPFSAI